MHVIMSFMFFFMLSIFLVRFETEDHFCFLGTFFWHVFIDYRGIILLFFFFFNNNFVWNLPFIFLLLCEVSFLELLDSFSNFRMFPLFLYNYVILLSEIS